MKTTHKVAARINHSNGILRISLSAVGAKLGVEYFEAVGAKDFDPDITINHPGPDHRGSHFSFNVPLEQAELLQKMLKAASKISALRKNNLLPVEEKALVKWVDFILQVVDLPKAGHVVYRKSE